MSLQSTFRRTWQKRLSAGSRPITTLGRPDGAHPKSLLSPSDAAVKTSQSLVRLPALASRSLFVLLLLLSAAPVRAAEPPRRDIRIYPVNRRVSAFPTNEDLSTPEAAYATIQREWMAEGVAAFSRLSVQEKARTSSPPPKKPVPAKDAAKWLAAEVLEVNIYQETNACVFAKLDVYGKEEVDMRWLKLEKGRWINDGNDRRDTVEQARAKYANSCAYAEGKARLASRPPIANPEEYLRPFVEFLRREAADPQAFLLQALAKHRLVILGEVHHRPRYWALNCSLVHDKAFAKEAGVIYLELPSNDQALVDQFLAAPQYDPQPVIEMLRDNLWTGWPDQPMLDFFKAVWEANQPLPEAQRLRIVLVDMQRPWKQITKRADWKQYDVDRNQFMADNVLKDLRQHSADPRHALFIVGYAHAMMNLTSPGGDPIKSAGWHLREQLGQTNLCVLFPHSPVMANMGGVNGRIALGLFETAFAALTNRPMAFPLDHGPFGEKVFDASMDELTTDPFRNGYHAYLYLGPLEDEVFSPLIPGFYTDDFVKELDRRHQLMFGKGLVKGEGLKRLDAASFVQWMSNSWGQPRHEWAASELGPLRAWQWGAGWEKQVTAAKLAHWAQDKPAIRQSALRLLEAIRKADYEHPGDWHDFPSPDVSYQVYTDYPSWMHWVCQHFRTNPITAVELGEVAAQTNGLPAMPYRLALQNGSNLKGVLPMKYDARASAWFGAAGLDWHLRSPKGVTQPRTAQP
jgi:hypothetical protein